MSLPVNDILRKLPKVDRLLTLLGEDADIWAVRSVLEDLRHRILAGAICDVPDEAEILGSIVEKSREAAAFGLQPVINATGIVLHTNLGRAPLPLSVAEHVKQMAMGYCALEYDLAAGARGSRTAAVARRLARLTGASAAICVNNNAAAVLLALAALCGGGEVIVARGEMVEVGGSFRIPDVIVQGGARLVEVGATNKVCAADYEAALTADTAAILKVHTSNYRIVGFTEEVSAADLARLARKHGLPLIYDLGGGALVGLSKFEPTVQEIVQKGADVLCFSGDKLLGGPQCGIILGRAEYVGKIAKHPLYRALRPDKLTLAALEATLKLYEDGAQKEIPALAMLTRDLADLRRDVQTLFDAIVPMPSRFTAKIVETAGQAGGGSLPTEDFPSYAVAISPMSMSLQELEGRLRRQEIPIIARIHQEQLLLDIRTVSLKEIAMVAAAINAIFGGEAP